MGFLLLTAMTMKFEARNPKAERQTTGGARVLARAPGGVGQSDFGFRHSDWLRIARMRPLDFIGSRGGFRGLMTRA